ncbi:MAG: DUF924 family protein [Pseudomonadota bacterium]
MAGPDAIDAVLDFWIDEIGVERWYVSDPDIDRAIEERFGALHAAAAAGGHRDWMLSARGALALLILLDQFSRNLYRGDARAFASDSEARRLAICAIGLGYDLRIAEPERQFFYLPLMHSESLSDQERCLRLFLLNCPATGGENVPHAIDHRTVIRRFGRFPSRNSALARGDTAAELAYRADGGYMG